MSESTVRMEGYKNRNGIQMYVEMEARDIGGLV